MVQAKRAAARAAVLGAACLLAVPALLSAVQEEGGGAIFSVNLGLVIWTWVLFLLTLGVLAWKVFPFIAGSLEERQRRIQEEIDAARREREEAERFREEQRREMEESRREAQRIVDKGREAGENLRQQILAEAREEQQELLRRARQELAREREQLREGVRREAVDIALAATERLLRERVDAEENRRLVRDYVSRIS